MYAKSENYILLTDSFTYAMEFVKFKRCWQLMSFSV